MTSFFRNKKFALNKETKKIEKINYYSQSKIIAEKYVKKNKKNLIIRTNFNSKIGLGHLFRTKILAKNFEQQKYKIIYALDYKVENKNLLNYEYFYLYSKNKKFTVFY